MIVDSMIRQVYFDDHNKDVIQPKHGNYGNNHCSRRTQFTRKISYYTRLDLGCSDLTRYGPGAMISIVINFTQNIDFIVVPLVPQIAPAYMAELFKSPFGTSLFTLLNPCVLLSIYLLLELIRILYSELSHLLPLQNVSVKPIINVIIMSQ